MKTLSSLWDSIQQFLFPALDFEIGPLSEQQQKLVSVIELIGPNIDLGKYSWVGNGRKPSHRLSLFKTFVAKSIYNFSETKSFLEYLRSSPALRRLCGFESVGEIPSESTFSRAFSQFAVGGLPSLVHEAMVKTHLSQKLFGHRSTDASAILAREKPTPKKKEIQPPKKRGRPRKGESPRPKEPTKLSIQLGRNMAKNQEDLPTICDFGTKKNSKGKTMHWIGYKLHLDAVDGDIPVSALLTSASTYDNQVAIPLAQMTSQRVTTLYDLADAAYDAQEIRDYSKQLGHIPIIDHNPRRGEKREFKPAEKIRFGERTSVERVFSNLKDNFGCLNFKVRGHLKVMAHLMFGVLALTATQILRLIT